MFTCIVFFHVYPSCIFGGCSRQRNNGNQEIKKFLDSSSFKFKEKEAWQTANEVDSCLIRRGSDGQCMLHRAMWTCIGTGSRRQAVDVSAGSSDFFNECIILQYYIRLCIYYAFVFMWWLKFAFGDWLLSVSCCFKCFSGSNYLQLHSRGGKLNGNWPAFWPYCWCGGWSRGWWGIRLHPSMPWVSSKILILASWDWSFFHAKQVRTSSFCTCSVRSHRLLHHHWKQEYLTCT